MIQFNQFINGLKEIAVICVQTFSFFFLSFLSKNTKILKMLVKCMFYVEFYFNW